MNTNNDIIIYTTEDGVTKIETTFDGDTVWLSIDRMAEFFEWDNSTISHHIKNIFAVRKGFRKKTLLHTLSISRVVPSNAFNNICYNKILFVAFAAQKLPSIIGDDVYSFPIIKLKPSGILIHIHFSL